jgi:hypothetical protein
MPQVEDHWYRLFSGKVVTHIHMKGKGHNPLQVYRNSEWGKSPQQYYHKREMEL